MELYIVLGWLVGLLCGLQYNKEKILRLKSINRFCKRYIKYLVNFNK
jgi:hypothetical protein